MSKHYVSNDYDVGDYELDHYLTPIDVKICHGCGASLDVYGKVIDCRGYITWEVRKCLRCGDVSLIDL